MKFVLLALILLLIAPAVAQDDLAGKLVYSNEGDIYSLSLDGSEPIQLTTHPAADFDPVWSPDGTKIAFRSHRDENPEVYVMDADGSNQVNLTNKPNSDYSPAWSPDGTKIAFASNRAGRSGNDIWVMNADGSEPVQITDIAGISEYPSWSPDGSQLAFHCTFGKRLANGTGDFEICVVNVDGTGLLQITDTEGENKQPAWSPDGTKIAFESNRLGWPSLPDYVPLGYDEGDFGDHEIYMMDVDGANQVNLSNNPREGDSFPAWSADGHIIFSRYGCLMVMLADGSALERLTASSGCIGADSGQFPDWFQTSDDD